ELTWTVNVVGVVAGACEEAKILFAPHRSADALIFHRLSPPFTQRYHGRLVPLSVFRLEAHCGQRRPIALIVLGTKRPPLFWSARASRFWVMADQCLAGR